MFLQIYHIPTGAHVHTYKYVYILSVLGKTWCAVNQERLLYAGFA